MSSLQLVAGSIPAAADVSNTDPNGGTNGAGLVDVRNLNLPADSEILQLENVFLSPHFSGLTGEAHPHFFRLMVDELERFFAGHETWYDLTPRSLANRRGEPSDRG